MRAYLAPLLLTALASPVLAQPLTGLFEWQVSRDGVAWSSSITVNPGSTYRIRAVGSWTDGAVPSHGFAGCTFDQLNLIGANDTDIFGEAQVGGEPIFFWRMRGGVVETWKLLPGTGASAGSLKIDNPNSPGRVNVGQIHYECWGAGIPYLDYIFDNPLVLFDFEAIAGDPKTITLQAPWTRLGSPPSNEFKIYTNGCGTNRKPVQEADQLLAHVWIRPNAFCTPDFNGDGLVDLADYLEFLSFYDTRDFRADLDRDRVVDFPDYLEFLNAFEAGC